jgi:hypothetical protein
MLWRHEYQLRACSSKLTCITSCWHALLASDTAWHEYYLRACSSRHLYKKKIRISELLSFQHTHTHTCIRIQVSARAHTHTHTHTQEERSWAEREGGGSGGWGWGGGERERERERERESEREWGERMGFDFFPRLRGLSIFHDTLLYFLMLQVTFTFFFALTPKKRCKYRTLAVWSLQ